MYVIISNFSAKSTKTRRPPEGRLPLSRMPEEGFNEAIEPFKRGAQRLQ